MLEFAEYGYWGLLLASFLAATIIPFSSEALFAYLIYKGFSVEYCVFAASTGNWLGGMSGFALGRAGRLDFVSKYFRIKQNKILFYENKIDSYGSLLAFFCWLPFIGDIIAVALGYFKCRLFPVSFWMLIGKGLRYIVLAMGIVHVGM